MEQNKIDKRIHALIEKCIVCNHRLLFVILGEKGLNTVPTLCKLVEKKVFRENCDREKFSVLWCSKDRIDIRSIGWPTNEDYNVTYCLYSDMESIRHKKFNFAIVRDNVDNIRPSHLANLVNSICGRGALIFLFSEIDQLEELTMPKNSDSMKSRFIKHFYASFETNPCCAIMDDELNVLFPRNGFQQHLKNEILPNSDSGQDLQHEDKCRGLTKNCSTVDQINFFMQCLDTLKKNCSYSTVSASSPIGRGKSAVLGLAIAAAIDMKYSKIFISSLNFENVSVVFKFLFQGLDALGYEEHKDYDINKYDSPMLNTVVLGLDIFKDHRQAVRFVFPGEIRTQVEKAQLVIIDEAAAIPLPLLKNLIGPCVVLMASSTEGCGASGKFLYENMINEIRRPSSCGSKMPSVSLFPTSERNTLVTMELNEPLHYAAEDSVEKWINHSLFLSGSVTNLSIGLPPLELCRLFYVCRDTLFSYESHAEKFLQQLMSLFLCSKREISPDDLLTIADGKDYHIFCLLPPPDNSGKTSYEIICAILVHKVKRVPENVMNWGELYLNSSLECFNDWKPVFEGERDFLLMQGIHILNIVTHPTYNHKDYDYDFRALQLLQEFYSGKSVSLDDNPFIYSTESDDTKQDLPLLLQLTEVQPEKVEYFLVSYFLTPQLLKFWKRSGFVPMYITCNKNSAREHLCIMMKGFEDKEILEYMKDNWNYFIDNYFLFLSNRMRYFPSVLAMELLISTFSRQMPQEALTKESIDIYLKPQDMKALEKYCQILGDLQTIVPFATTLAQLYFKNRFVGVDMTAIQQTVFLSFALQHKAINEISRETALPSTQVHAVLNQVIKKLFKYLNGIIEKDIEKTLPVRDVKMVPVLQSIDEELNEAALQIQEKQAESLRKLKETDFSEFAIKGSEDDWEKALHTGRKTLVSIKSLSKVPENVEIPQPKKKKFMKRKK